MKKIFISTVLWVGLCALLVADDKIARDIMQKVKDRDTGKSSIASMQMILIDKQNSKRVRTTTQYSLNQKNMSKKIIFFTSPSSVDGTAFLVYDYDGKDSQDDQWMYLPALKKTKRIPASDKSASFMGSDFTNADMTEPELSNYNYALLREDVFKKIPVWVIEATPRNQKIVSETGYKKSEMYIRKDIYMPIAGKHYLANSDKYKLYQVGDFKKINGIWFGSLVSMTTKQGKNTLHQTILKMTDIKVNEPIKDEFFSVRSIEKGL